MQKKIGRFIEKPGEIDICWILTKISASYQLTPKFDFNQKPISGEKKFSNALLEGGKMVEKLRLMLKQSHGWDITLSYVWICFIKWFPILKNKKNKKLIAWFKNSFLF